MRSARSADPSSPVEVRLAAGTHRLDAPLTFSAEDSGQSANAPIRYVGPDGEGEDFGEAVLSGAVEVSPSSWTLVSPGSDPTLFQAVLPTDTVYFHQLFVNGTLRTRSQTDTFAYTEAASDGSYLEVSASVFAQLPDLSDLDGVYCVCYESWTASFHEISRVDAETRRLYLAQPFNEEWPPRRATASTSTAPPGARGTTWRGTSTTTAPPTSSRTAPPTTPRPRPSRRAPPRWRCRS